MERVHALLPAGLAVAAALFMAWGTVLRHRDSATSGLGPLWWLGAGIAVGGFVLQAAALSLGPVLLVQPLIVLAVAFAIPFEMWLAGAMPRLEQWVWAALLVAGVAAFVVFARPIRSRIGPQPWILALVVALLLAVLVAIVVYSERSPAAPRALLRGTVAGSMFGIAAVLLNTLGHRWEHPLRLLQSPAVYLLALVALVGLYFQQRAFAAGAVQASFPALTIAELLVSMGLGLAILGEKLNRHTWATAVSLTGLAVTIAAVLRLSRLDGPGADRPDTEGPRVVGPRVVGPGVEGPGVAELHIEVLRVEGACADRGERPGTARRVPPDA